MQRYVAGLLFDQFGFNVLLLLKNRPLWQAGLYNAIGGKVEPEETSLEAMTRESKEEIGVDPQWEWFMQLEGHEFAVDFYRAFDEMAYQKATAMESEPIDRFSVNKLPSEDCVPNIHWIIPMALNETWFNNTNVYRVAEMPF